jgi:hypothetical protein
LTELKLSKILHLFKEMNGKTFYYQSKTSMRASTNTMRVQFSSILFPRQFCLNSTCKKINMPLNLHDQTYHVLRAISEHSLIKWCHCEHLQEGILKGLRVWAAGLKLFIVSNENLMCCFCIGCLLWLNLDRNVDIFEFAKSYFWRHLSVSSRHIDLTREHVADIMRCRASFCVSYFVSCPRLPTCLFGQ